MSWRYAHLIACRHERTKQFMLLLHAASWSRTGAGHCNLSFKRKTFM